MNQIKFGNNNFCGPAVLSAITGCTTDDAEKMIQRVTGKYKKVTGVYTTDLCEAFKRFGYHPVRLSHLSDCGNLFSLLGILGEAGQYVVVVPGHFICIEIGANGERFLCDNHTKKPININTSARLMQRVVEVVRIDYE